MKKYYIIRSDGSSIFSQAYERDFIFHCLAKLLDSSEDNYFLLEVELDCKFVKLSRTRAGCICLSEPWCESSYTYVYT